MRRPQMAKESPRRKFWGWGDVGQGLDAGEQEALRQRYAKAYGAEMRGPKAPRVDEIPLRAPRLEASASPRRGGPGWADGRRRGSTISLGAGRASKRRRASPRSPPPIRGSAWCT